MEETRNHLVLTWSRRQISIPGAKRIRVVFDEECSTEMGCDFVRIYKGMRLGISGAFVQNLTAESDY